MRRDIVLVTVDSWRFDALSRMPALRERTDGPDWSVGEAVCAGCATNWTFPALLAGSYYPRVYDGDAVDPDARPLPAVLADAGYATGGFVGSNPYLTKWAPFFERFWNDGLERDDEENPDLVARTEDRARRFLSFEKRAPVSAVAPRAAEWYRDVSGPRFCWVHLMEPHLPYYPGIDRAREVGLLRAYAATLDFHLRGTDAADRTLLTVRRLYRQCLDRLDAALDDLFAFVDDDAVVVLVGDHGEDFGHGVYDHLRLYDECVRVPLLARHLDGELSFDLPASVRQLDLPGALLAAVDVDRPETWDGSDGRVDAGAGTLMLSPDPAAGRVYAGVRTDRYKLIRTYDRERRTWVDEELYDLHADPGETRNVRGERGVPDLTARLDEFLARPEVRGAVDGELGDRESVSDAVAARLSELGYR